MIQKHKKRFEPKPHAICKTGNAELWYTKNGGQT